MTSPGRATCAHDRAEHVRAERARENSAYLHRLLRERQPEFLAALRAAERRLDLELSGRAVAVAAEPEPEEP